MASVAHSTLTGADLHEPKGIASAALNTVYVANGAGSGTWSSAAAILSVTGMIADFALPAAPTGWLECDGTQQSRATFASLFAAITIQQSGTRVSGTATITGLSSTANMRAGYAIGGTGITNGTHILSVDSGSQVTMDANATSSGTNTVIVSPWALGDGSTTFNLPDTKTSGRYRRSRTASSQVGSLQSDVFKTHNHTASGSTTVNNTTVSIDSVGNIGINVFGVVGGNLSHSHDTFVSLSGSTGNMSANNPHHHNYQRSNDNNRAVNATGANTTANAGLFTDNTSDTDIDHTHSWGSSGTFTSGGSSFNLDHTHTANSNSHSHTSPAHNHTATTTVTTDPTGSAVETRPITIIIMTCIKT